MAGVSLGDLHFNADLFWEKVDKSGDCWEWTAAGNQPPGAPRAPYGVFGVRRAGGRWGNFYVHRLSYLMHCGDIPEGLLVCHTCDNRLCVRPGHLFLGTAAANTADMHAKGRWKLPGRSRGEAHPGAKVTDAGISEIRKLSAEGATIRELAARFGLSYSYTYKITSGKFFKRRVAA